MMLMRWAGVTPEQYDEARERVGWEWNPAPGGIFHVAAFADDGMHVTDVWESAEDFQRFVGPIGVLVRRETLVGPVVLRPPGPGRAARGSGPPTSDQAIAGSATAAARSKTSSLSRASIRIVSPSPNSPSRSAIASGFSTRRWSARLSGRAP